MSKHFILLVEDNQNDEELTLRALKKNDLPMDIMVARDGAEALDYLFSKGRYADRKPETDPQIVLLDLNLPKIGGLEVLRALRDHEKTKYLPVVILTSSKQDRDLIDGYKLGVNSYVVKPVDFQNFSAAVRELGLYWLQINQRPV